MPNGKRAIKHTLVWTIALIVILIIGYYFLTHQKNQPKMKAYCAQFSSQKEAQDYMKKYNATYLDGDHDGKACEALP